MAKHLTPFEQILFATVRIEADDDSVGWIGTGFFYAVSAGPEREVVLLISNRHVLEPASRLTFWCHLKDQFEDPSGDQEHFQVRLGPGDVIGHPDPEVDLAGLPIGSFLNALISAGRPPFIKTFREDTLPSDKDWAGFDAAQDIFMVGCPLGLYDDYNKFPIFRRGLTASHLAYRYKGRNEFLVDVAAFEGSSGSPIFVNQERKYNREIGQYEQSNLATDIKLVGILSSGPEYTQVEEIELAKKRQVKIRMPMHLGVAVRSSEILPIAVMVRAALGL